MPFNWFSRKGILFIPSSVIGWLILIAAIIYTVFIFIDIDRRTHSASDTLINFVFTCLIIGAIYSLIGLLTAKRI